MLTAEQKTIMQSDINGDPTLLGYWNDGNPSLVADAYNVVGSSYCWKSRLTKTEVLSGIVWTELIARTPSEQLAFDLMLGMGWINPSDPNIRQGIADVFSGAGGANTRASLVDRSKRLMTRGEALFKTGGSGAINDPATLGFEGSVFWQDVVDAMRT